MKIVCSNDPKFLRETCLADVYKWQQNYVNGRAYLLVPDSCKLDMEMAYLKEYEESTLMLVDVQSLSSFCQQIIKAVYSPSYLQKYASFEMELILLKECLLKLGAKDAKFKTFSLSKVYLQNLLDIFSTLRSVGFDCDSHADVHASLGQFFAEKLKNLYADHELQDILVIYQEFESYLKKIGVKRLVDIYADVCALLADRENLPLAVSEMLNKSTYFFYGLARFRHLNYNEWKLILHLGIYAKDMRFYLNLSKEAYSEFLQHNPAKKDMPFSEAYFCTAYWAKRLANTFASTLEFNDFKLDSLLPQETAIYKLNRQEDIVYYAEKLILDKFKDGSWQRLGLISFLPAYENKILINNLSDVGISVYNDENYNFSRSILYDFLLQLKNLLLSYKTNDFNVSILLNFLRHSLVAWHKMPRRADKFDEGYNNCENLKKMQLTQLENFLLAFNCHSFTKFFELLDLVVQYKEENKTQIPLFVEKMLEYYSIDDILSLNSQLKNIFALTKKKEKNYYYALALLFDSLFLRQNMEDLRLQCLESSNDEGLDLALGYSKHFGILHEQLRQLALYNQEACENIFEALNNLIFVTRNLAREKIPNRQTQIYLGNIFEVLEQNFTDILVLGANFGEFPLSLTKENIHNRKVKNYLMEFQKQLDVLSEEKEQLSEDLLNVIKGNEIFPFADKEKQHKQVEDNLYLSLILQSRKSLIFIQDNDDNSPQVFFNFLKRAYKKYSANSSEKLLKEIEVQKGEILPSDLRKYMLINKHMDRTLSETERGFSLPNFWLKFILMNGDRIKFSPTKFELYRASPYLFFLKYVLRTKDKITELVPSNLAGSFIHDCMEKYWQAFFKQDDKLAFWNINKQKLSELWQDNNFNILKYLKNNYNAISQSFDNFIRQHIIDDAKYFVFKENMVLQNELHHMKQSFLCEFFSLLHNYRLENLQNSENKITEKPRFYPLKFEEKIEDEIKISELIKDYENLHENLRPQDIANLEANKNLIIDIKGKIDRLDPMFREELEDYKSAFLKNVDDLSGFRIVDYKTGIKEINKEKIAAAFDMQMPLYAFLYQKRLFSHGLDEEGLKNLYIDCQYIKLNKKNVTKKELILAYSDKKKNGEGIDVQEKIKDIRLQILYLLAQILNDEPRPFLYRPASLIKDGENLNVFDDYLYNELQKYKKISLDEGHYHFVVARELNEDTKNKKEED